MLFATAPPGTPGGGLPAWVPAVGAWAEISGTALSSVEPSPVPGGSTGARSKTDAWTSFAVDTSTSKVYCVAQGGHADYSGNEADCLTLDTASPSWAELRAPTATVSNSDYYSDGRPVSRHSYYGVTVDETNGRVMLFGGSRYSDGTAMLVVDSFRFDTSDYNVSGTHPSIPSSVNQEVRAICRDPSNDDVYVAANWNMARWNRASNTWTNLISDQSGSYAQNTGSAFDTTRNRIFAVGDGRCWTYDVAGNAFTNRTLSGTDLSVPVNQAVVYVAAIDRFLVRGSAAGGTVYSVHPTTFAVSDFGATGGGSIPSTAAGPYNKFLYVPALQGCVYVPTYTGNAWFLRVH